MNYFLNAIYSTKSTLFDIEEEIILQSSWKQKNFIVQTNFHHEKQHGFIRLVGNVVYLPKLILTTVGTIGCAMCGTQCQDVWHQNDDAAEPYLPNVKVVDIVCGVPLCYLGSWFCEPCAVSLVCHGASLYVLSNVSICKSLKDYFLLIKGFKLNASDSPLNSNNPEINSQSIQQSQSKTGLA